MEGCTAARNSNSLYFIKIFTQVYWWTLFSANQTSKSSFKLKKKYTSAEFLISTTEIASTAQVDDHTAVHPLLSSFPPTLLHASTALALSLSLTVLWECIPVQP